MSNIDIYSFNNLSFGALSRQMAVSTTRSTEFLNKYQSYIELKGLLGSSVMQFERDKRAAVELLQRFESMHHSLEDCCLVELNQSMNISIPNELKELATLYQITGSM